MTTDIYPPKAPIDGDPEKHHLVVAFITVNHTWVVYRAWNDDRLHMTIVGIPPCSKQIASYSANVIANVTGEAVSWRSHTVAELRAELGHCLLGEAAP